MQVRMPIQTRWLAVLLSLSLLPILAWSQERPAALAALQVEDLTLEQAIALALSDNRLVKIAQLDVGKVADNWTMVVWIEAPPSNCKRGLQPLTEIPDARRGPDLAGVSEGGVGCWFRK